MTQEMEIEWGRESAGDRGRNRDGVEVRGEELLLQM